MNQLQVVLPEASYPIEFGEGVVGAELRAALDRPAWAGRRAAVLVDQSIATVLGNELGAVFGAAPVLILPAGESTKALESLGAVWEWLARERIEAMKRIWTEEEPEYQGEFVRFGPMKQWPKPVQRPHPPIIVGGAFPHAARRAVRYGDGWIPRDDWLERDGVGVIEQFHAMAREAGRDPASLPITLFRVPPDIERLRLYRRLGIDRVVFSLPAEPAPAIEPILDRWAELQRALAD